MRRVFLCNRAPYFFLAIEQYVVYYTVMVNTQQLLKRWLHAEHLTQQAAAQRLGVTQGTVGHWLTGRRRPGLEHLDHLASVLGVAPSQLRPDLADLFVRNGTRRRTGTHRQ